MAVRSIPPINLIKKAIGEAERVDSLKNYYPFRQSCLFYGNGILIFPETIDKFCEKGKNGEKYGFVLCKYVGSDGCKKICQFYVGTCLRKFNTGKKVESYYERDQDHFIFDKINGVSFKKYFLYDSDSLREDACDTLASQLAGKHLLVSDVSDYMVWNDSLFNVISRTMYSFVTITPDESLILLRKYCKCKDVLPSEIPNIKYIKERANGWPKLFNELPYNFLFNYYPTTCDFEASESEWKDRRTVWDFKNTPDRTTRYRHNEALARVLPLLEFNLIFDFGFYFLKNMTLVCIPASNQINNEARYKEFSDRLCHETGMTNSYDRITVTHEKQERRKGGTSIGMSNLSIDESFFKDRYILLFDDVITRGDSMMTFKEKIESLGAHVVAGVCIGRTKHKR